MGQILKRHDLVIPRRRKRRSPPYAEPFVASEQPNDVWCADFKGWFRTGDGARCDPFTLTDNCSRYLLRCQAVTSPDHSRVRPILETAFREYGLPRAMRTDNGPPFASTTVRGLSRLSIWWIKLGIIPERIDPGRPEQNGRHERMHRTLKEETATPPQATLGAQQRAFHRFCREYNEERPHEGIGQQTPGSRYRPSARPYPLLVPEFTYPRGFMLRTVRGPGLDPGSNGVRGRSTSVRRWPGKSLVLTSSTMIAGKSTWVRWLWPCSTRGPSASHQKTTKNQSI
jgi:transposase InsO family protein